MDHNRLQDALHALHDNELGAAERNEVLSHMERCGECKEIYQRWERIAGTFFMPSQKPSSAETELFVQRVMGRLATENSRAPLSWWPWLEDNFMVPVLSLSLAAALLSIILVQPESIASADTLLLVNSQNHMVGQWVLPPDPSNAGMLLAPEAK